MCKGLDVSIHKIESYGGKGVIEPQREVNDVGVDFVYAVQNQIVTRWFVNFLQKNPDLTKSNTGPSTIRCIDIGSQTGFITLLASFANFILVDPSLSLSAATLYHPEMGVAFASAEAQDLSIFEDQSFVWISSLHAIEHFGLGRYGDKIDPLGDIRGLREIYRLLRNNGIFVGSVPIVEKKFEKIEFNKNRLYSIETIKKMLKDCGFDIVNETIAHSPTPTATLTNSVPGQAPVTPVLRMSVKEFDSVYASGKMDIYKKPPDAAYIWVATKKCDTSNPQDVVLTNFRSAKEE